MNLLLTSVGRRVELVRFFKRALAGSGRVFAGDVDRTAPGLYEADQGFLLPKVNDKNYIEELIILCKKNSISLVIPLIDTELFVLSTSQDLFKRERILALISRPEVITLCRDKLKTANFFKKHNIPSPHTFSNLSDVEEEPYLLVIKPRFGSAGKDVFICKNKNDLMFYQQKIKEPIIQEYIRGSEITIDVLCNLTGKVLEVVPRKRLKIRGGEVERGITINDENLINWAIRIADYLKAVGPINIQCFLAERGSVFTEINPRFGGGYPLSYYAGANFPEMIIKMVRGEDIYPCIGSFKDRCVMMRYDHAIFRREDELLF